MNFWLTRMSQTLLATPNKHNGYGELLLVPKEEDAGYYPASSKDVTLVKSMSYNITNGGGGNRTRVL